MRERSADITAEQDHEFELVLGNKQLFGMLFIVFVLLGVFFAMGYVMGRNSGAGDTTADIKPETVRAEGETSPSLPRRSAMGPNTVQSSGGASETSLKTLPDDPPTIPVPKQKAEAAAREAATESGPVSVTEPRPGQMFLQVSAAAKPLAELLVDVLRRKNFHAIIAPGPNEQMFRVLVGPVKDDAEVGRLRSELEQAGFKPIPRRY